MRDWLRRAPSVCASPAANNLNSTHPTRKTPYPLRVGSDKCLLDVVYFLAMKKGATTGDRRRHERSASARQRGRPHKDRIRAAFYCQCSLHDDDTRVQRHTLPCLRRHLRLVARCLHRNEYYVGHRLPRNRTQATRNHSAARAYLLHYRAEHRGLCPVCRGRRSRVRTGDCRWRHGRGPHRPVGHHLVAAVPRTSAAPTGMSLHGNVGPDGHRTGVCGKRMGALWAGEPYRGCLKHRHRRSLPAPHQEFLQAATPG